ncbi:MAG: alpha/beta hydrolase [bacterium]|nr:alpha/beta hydrolase [bacterium]
MHYYEKGTGFPLLLLHGYCETGSVWKNVEESLSTKYRLIIPDLPGFGKSNLISDFNLEDIAVSLNDLISKLGVSEFIVLGHSLGGYIALAMEKLYPKCVKGFGLIHSTAFEDNEEKKAGRNQVVKIVSEKGPGLFLQNFYQNLFYQQIEEVIGDLQQEGKQIKGESIIAYAKAMRDRPDSSDLLKSEKPKLVVAGVKDGAVPIENSRRMKGIANNCDYIELENTGHMGMFEEPEALLSGIESFLDRAI